MNVAIIQNGEETVAKVDGRLDTLSATELGDSLSAYTCTPQINLVLDCSGLEYIGSAGLRILLMLHKSIVSKKGKFILRHLNPEVKSVFDMTGFSQILTLE